MVIVWQKVAQLALGKLLTDPKHKERVIRELREAAEETKDTEWDDRFVNVLDSAWDPIVAIVLGKPPF